MNEQEHNRLNDITARLHDAIVKLETFERDQKKEIEELKRENKELRDQLGVELGGW